ncbi:hypothetical protein Tco_0500366 [Tanacetum coccineum]
MTSRPKQRRLRRSSFIMTPKKKVQIAQKQRASQSDSPMNPLERQEHETGLAPSKESKEFVSKQDIISSKEFREVGEQEQDLEDTCEDLRTPYKRPNPTSFTTRITRFKYHKRAKLPRNVKVYEGSKDLEDYLSIFSAAMEQEEWLMPLESSHIKGVPPVLRISAFMHGHEHPRLAKKLNDKILKMVDEMFERVRAFVRGEAAAGSAEVARSPQWDKGNARTGWSGG